MLGRRLNFFQHYSIESTMLIQLFFFLTLIYWSSELELLIITSSLCEASAILNLLK